MLLIFEKKIPTSGAAQNVLLSWGSACHILEHHYKLGSFVDFRVYANVGIMELKNLFGDRQTQRPNHSSA